MPKKYAYSSYTRKQLLVSSMVLVERMKQRPDYSPERIPELLEREAGLEEKALHQFSPERRLQILRELAVYGLKKEAGKSTEEITQILGYRSRDRVREINNTMRVAYETYFEEVKKLMAPPATLPPSEQELTERKYQEILCERLQREFPALKQFSNLSLDELTERFGLAALYSTDKRTLRGALERYFQ